MRPLSGYAGLVPGTTSAIAITHEVKAGVPLTATTPGSDGPQSSQILPAGSVRITASPADKTYAIEVAVQGFPASRTFDLSHVNAFGETTAEPSEFGNHVTKTVKQADGTATTTEYDAVSGASYTPIANTSPTTAESFLFTYNLGLHYVSYGSWNRTEYLRVGTAYQSGLGIPGQEILFVTGRRTGASELPLTGTATYDARIVGGNQVIDRDGYGISRIDTFTLDADFGRRSIAATLKTTADVSYDPAGDFFRSITGLDVSGSGPLRMDGSFGIDLAGTNLILNGGPGGSPLTRQVTGTLEGAFFGPGAEETGGVLQLLRDGTLGFVGSFVGARTGP